MQHRATGIGVVWNGLLCLSVLLSFAQIAFSQSECEESELQYSCKKQITDYYALHWSLGPTTAGATAGEGEIAIAMVGETEGWVGFAFAEVEGSMAPADFVIGWVDGEDVVVTPYRAEISFISADNEDDNIELTDVEGTEEDGMTTIRFVRSLTEGTTEVIVDGEMLINVAIGANDALEQHSPEERTSSTVMLMLAADTDTTPDDENPAAESPVSEIAPAGDEAGCRVSDLGYTCSIDLSDAVVMHWTLGPFAGSDEVPELSEDQIAIAAVGQTTGYLSIAFPETTGVMVPAEGVIGWQTADGEASIQHYTLTERDASGVVVADNQAISETTCGEEDGVTTISFVYDLSTLPGTLNVEEMPINWAYHTADEIAYHSTTRGGTTVNLLGEGTSETQTADAPEEAVDQESQTAESTTGGCGASDLGYNCAALFERVTVHSTVGPSPASNDIPEVAEGEVAFALVAATTGWIGIGFAETAGDMAPADVILGWVSGNDVMIQGYSISRKSIVEGDATDSIVLRDIQGSEIDGTTTLQFVLAELPNSADFTQDINLNYAVGPSDSLQIHSSRGGGTANLLSGEATTVEEDLTKYRAHGAMMIIAWIGLVPFGIFMARHKTLFRGLGEGAWFQIHRAVQSLALIFMFVGMVIALSEFDDPASKEGKRHRRVGIAILTLGFLQGVVPFVRPGHESPFRFAFNYFHWYLGRGCAILGIATVFLGINAYDLFTDTDVDNYWITCLVILAVHFAFAAVAEVYKTYIVTEEENKVHKQPSQRMETEMEPQYGGEGQAEMRA